MLKLNEASIKLKCYSDEVYKKGLSYYLTGRVNNVRADGNCIKGQVIGTYDYNVEAGFFADGQLEYAQCECRAFDNYPGFCKHLVAFLLYLKNESSIVENMRDGRISGKILDYFDSRIGSTARNAVNMEVMLELISSGVYGRKIQPAVSLRIGDKKLYQVKNMKRFIEQVESKNIIVFGKCFTYDPVYYCFKDTDKPLIDLFREMYQIDSISNGNADYFHGSGTVFKDKYLYLSSESLDRLLKIIGDREFGFTYRNIRYEKVRVVQEELPVDFELRKSDNDLLLDVVLPDNMLVLTPEGKYVFYQGCIYSISDSQRDSLLPFYNAVMQTNNSTIRFLQKDRGKFASIVMPHLMSAGRLNIDENISGMFYQQPLISKAYLDKDGQRITVEVNFQYGGLTINPFRVNQSAEDEADTVIMRDVESERKVLHLIEQSGFRINKESIYLENDEKIYDFVTQILPELQRSCQVYYSESFKNMKIYGSSYCKSSVKLDKDLDFLEFNFSIEGVDNDELAGVFASFRRKKRYYRLKNGSFLPLNEGNLLSMSKLLEYIDADPRELKSSSFKVPKYKSLYMDEQLKSLDSIYVERSTAFKKLVQNIKEYKDIDFTLPEGINGTLREYQVSGFKWLKTLAHYGFGGILADDMGLGKTLQAIAFLLSEKENEAKPSIVVCPTSIIYNWESEIQRFAPSLSTLVISGSKFERDSVLKDIPDTDVVITSYPLIRRDIDNYRDISFAYCIIDEAQHIKNPNSQNARSVKDIKAKGYFALTGTPLENNLTELWSIFDFIMPGYLMRHDRFVEKFERPIAADQDKEALNELKKYIKPFILRRLKKDVLYELPPKIENVLTTELTENQKKVYLAYLQKIKGYLEEEVRQKGFEKSQIQILAGLTRLRQICCHPSLFIENYDGGSGKMDMLNEIIQELIDGGHRALIFSQFTGALKLIRNALDEQGISYFYLDGSIEAAERGRMVNLFNDGENSIFLISLKAGGTGLNLTGADTVIHFDPWWNPAAEDQATDRAYRIGQENTVQVMKLVTKGTIEEKIYKLQEKKKELIGSVLQPGETFISKMKEEDIMGLFNL